MRKVKFIYNPHSGDNKIVSKLDIIIKIYQKYGYTVIPYRIDFDQDINDAFDDSLEQFDHLLVSGGDGTIDRVVNLMKKANIELPLAILPTGTANDFANTLGISDNIETAIYNILSSKPKKIDIGKVNNEYFINVASAGMFTDVSQKINSDFKHSMGKISYYIKGIEDALNLRKFNINVTSEEFIYKGDMYLVLVFNGKTAGNINLAYKSEIDDGYLDIVIFRTMPIQQILRILIKIMRQEYLDAEDIIYFRTNKLCISCEEELTADIDGERGPDFPLTIECIKDGLEILGIK